eukprot:657818_1
MWSVGCVFAEMLTSTTPFPGRTELDQFKRIVKVCGSLGPGNWNEGTTFPWYNTMNPQKRYENQLKRRIFPESCKSYSPSALGCFSTASDSMSTFSNGTIESRRTVASAPILKPSPTAITPQSPLSPSRQVTPEMSPINGSPNELAKDNERWNDAPDKFYEKEYSRGDGPRSQLPHPHPT